MSGIAARKLGSTSLTGMVGNEIRVGPSDPSDSTFKSGGTELGGAFTHHHEKSDSASITVFFKLRTSKAIEPTHALPRERKLIYAHHVAGIE